MEIRDAIKIVGHSIREKEFLSIASGLGLSAPWTEEKAQVIRAVRTFPPSRAGKQIGLSADDFEQRAGESGLVPPWTHADIALVKLAITPDFPGMTSLQVAASLNMPVDWVRQAARENGIGEFVQPGCYMVAGERQRKTGAARAFLESDLETLADVLPKGSKRVLVDVPLVVHRKARSVAATDGETSVKVLSDWVQSGAAHALSE